MSSLLRMRLSLPRCATHAMARPTASVVVIGTSGSSRRSGATPYNTLCERTCGGGGQEFGAGWVYGVASEPGQSTLPTPTMRVPAGRLLRAIAACAVPGLQHFKAFRTVNAVLGLTDFGARRLLHLDD